MRTNTSFGIEMLADPPYRIDSENHAEPGSRRQTCDLATDHATTDEANCSNHISHPGPFSSCRVVSCYFTFELGGRASALSRLPFGALAYLDCRPTQYAPGILIVLTS